MSNQYHVIDADGHVQSQIDWEKELPQAYKADAPRKVFIYGEQPNWVIDGKIWPPRSARVVGTPASIRDRTFGDSRGQQDPHARIPDMDLEGDSVAVLFGALAESATNYLTDAGLATAMATVYNNWLAEYCSPYPDRLKGIAVTALQDPEGAARELRRAVKELGFVGAVVPPHALGKNLDHPDFRPLFEEAQELGVPITVHWGTSQNVEEAAGANRFGNYFYVHALGHPYQVGIALAALVCGGVMERFPRLKIAIMEAGCGWLPFWIGRFDEHFELLPHLVPITKKPSEFIRGENFFISCESDEPTLRYALDFVGEDRILYASDYRHFDCKFPDAVKELTDRDDLTETQKRKVLGENASKCYGLPMGVGS